MAGERTVATLTMMARAIFIDWLLGSRARDLRGLTSARIRGLGGPARDLWLAEV
jgi:hypothetical protein